VSLDPLKCTYLRYYISALNVLRALKILHALDIDAGNLAHTPTWTGIPQKFNREDLKFGLKFNNFGASGSIITKLVQITCREAGVIILVQFLEGPPPKFWDAVNTSKIRLDF